MWKISLTQNYNLFFFEDFDINFFISLIEISRISDILSENWKTQHKTLVLVFHMISIYSEAEKMEGKEEEEWNEENEEKKVTNKQGQDGIIVCLD